MHHWASGGSVPLRPLRRPCTQVLASAGKGQVDACPKAAWEERNVSVDTSALISSSCRHFSVPGFNALGGLGVTEGGMGLEISEIEKEEGRKGSSQSLLGAKADL